MEEMLKELLISLINKAPWGMGLLVVMAGLRAINKPLFALLNAYVLATPQVKDDELLKKVESSKAYKAILFALDWFASIKLPEKK